MTRKKTGSSPTSRENRNESRRSGHKNTTEARKAGKYLPTAEQKKSNKAQEQKVRAETPKRTDVQTKANRIIEDEKKKRR